MKPTESTTVSLLDDLDNETPVTSLPCQWKAPKKRKESTLPIAQATFEKHVFGKIKRKYALLENFDPRPIQYRGTAKDHLPSPLEKVHGKSLHNNHFCLMKAVKTAAQQTYQQIRSFTALPSIESLKKTVEAFKASLSMTEESIHKIGHDTREQQTSSLWYEVHHY